jgi:hypothetical protein
VGDIVLLPQDATNPGGVYGLAINLTGANNGSPFADNVQFQSSLHLPADWVTTTGTIPVPNAAANATLDAAIDPPAQTWVGSAAVGYANGYSFITLQAFGSNAGGYSLGPGPGNAAPATKTIVQITVTASQAIPSPIIFTVVDQTLGTSATCNFTGSNSCTSAVNLSVQAGDKIAVEFSDNVSGNLGTLLGSSFNVTPVNWTFVVQ